MKRYSEERKESVLRQMMPPMNTPVSVLAAETGISDVTLYHWRKQARTRGLVVPGDGRNSENWSSEDKFAVVLETAPMNEAELAEYCRKKGLFSEQIVTWKANCLQGNSSADRLSRSGVGSSAILHRAAFTPEQCERLFRQLQQDVEWEQQEISVYGKTHLQPRLVAWYGNAGASYTYSGLTLHPSPWIEPIVEIKTVCEAIAGTKFNSVLLNLYRDGDDTVGWHSDDEPTLGKNPTIASVSLGTMRRFDLRHKATKETVRTQLPAGSVLLMSGRLQAEWSHQVPRTKKVDSPRINLTFRRIRHA